jgi:hypothetical protein
MKTIKMKPGFTVSTYNEIPIVPDMGMSVHTISEMKLIDVSLINAAFKATMPYWRDDTIVERGQIKVSNKKITCRLDGCSHRRGECGCSKQNKIIRDKHKYLDHDEDNEDINVYIRCNLKEEVTSKW